MNSLRGDKIFFQADVLNVNTYKVTKHLGPNCISEIENGYLQIIVKYYQEIENPHAANQRDTGLGIVL